MTNNATNAQKTIVITGASDGIGAAAARALQRGGAEVVVVGRSPSKTAALAREIGAASYVADFAHLSEVRQLAAELLRSYPRIDVLANNAGLMSPARTTSADGHELTWQVNHLAPFLLTNLLKERLIESRASIIATSSVGNLAGRVNLQNLDSRGVYVGFLVYCTTKLENILFTKELARRWGAQGIHAAAFHPGAIASQFGNTGVSLIRLMYHTPLKHLYLRSPEQGADTLVWLAQSEAGRDWQSGRYFVNRRPGLPSIQANNADLARRLWNLSARMVGLEA